MKNKILLLLLVGSLSLWGCSSGVSATDALREATATTTQPVAKTSLPTATSTQPAVTSTQTATEVRSEPSPTADPGSETDSSEQQGETEATMGAEGDILADVIGVRVSGNEGAYQFAVEVSSPDTGCEQYADWWEVVTEEGELVYRRVLLHSHVGEQPFSRSGGPVAIDVGTPVWVRAHMNTEGYGGAAFKGSVQEGFEPAELSPDFAPNLAEEPPLPGDCAF